MLTHLNILPTPMSPSGVTASFGYSPLITPNHTQNIFNAVQEQIERGNDPFYVTGRVATSIGAKALEAAFGPPPQDRGYADVWIEAALRAVLPEWMNKNFGLGYFTTALLPSEQYTLNTTLVAEQPITTDETISQSAPTVTKYEALPAVPDAYDDFIKSCLNGNLDEAESAIQFLSPDVIASKGNRALYIAAEKGHLAVVDRLLEIEGVRNNAAAHDALHAASKHGHPAVVRCLLNIDAVRERAIRDLNLNFIADENVDKQITILINHLCPVELEKLVHIGDLEPYRENGKLISGIVAVDSNNEHIEGFEALELIFNRIKSVIVNTDNVSECLEVMRDIREQASMQASTQASILNPFKHNVIRVMDKEIKRLNFLNSLDKTIIEEAKNMSPDKVRIPLEQGPLNKNIQTKIVEKIVKEILLGENIEFEFKEGSIFAKMDNKEYSLTNLLESANLNHIHFDEMDSEVFLSYLQDNISNIDYELTYRDFGIAQTVEDFRRLGEVFKKHDYNNAIESLTLGEQLALNLYTGEFYKPCNSLLRGRVNNNTFQGANIEFTLVTAVMASSGLNKVSVGSIPKLSVRGELSLSNDILEQRIKAAQNGAITQELGFLSASDKASIPFLYKPLSAEKDLVLGTLNSILSYFVTPSKREAFVIFEDPIGKELSALSQNPEEQERLLIQGQYEWTGFVNKGDNLIFIAKPVWSPSASTKYTPALEAVHMLKSVYQASKMSSKSLEDSLEKLLVKTEDIDISSLNSLKHELSNLFNEIRAGLAIDESKSKEALMSMIFKMNSVLFVRAKLQRTASKMNDSDEIARIDSAINLLDFTLDEIQKISEMCADNKVDISPEVIRNAFTSINSTLPGLIRPEAPPPKDKEELHTPATERDIIQAESAITAPAINTIVTNTAQYVYNNYLSKPFTNPDIDWDWSLQTDQGEIPRPNHGLAHTLRVAHYVPTVVNFFKAFAPNKEDYQLSAEDIEKLQIVLLFSVTGRENEAGFQDSTVDFYRYVQKSASNFERYCREEIPGKFSNKEIERYKEALTTYGSPYETAPLKMIMKTAHKMDLLRCYSEEQFNKAMAGIDEVIGKENRYELTAYAEKVLIATGDRIITRGSVADPAFDSVPQFYQPNIFYRASTDVTNLSALLTTVPAPIPAAPHAQADHATSYTDSQALPQEPVVTKPEPQHRAEEYSQQGQQERIPEKAPKKTRNQGHRAKPILTMQPVETPKETPASENAKKKVADLGNLRPLHDTLQNLYQDLFGAKNMALALRKMSVAESWHAEGEDRIFEISVQLLNRYQLPALMEIQRVINGYMRCRIDVRPYPNATEIKVYVPDDIADLKVDELKSKLEGIQYQTPDGPKTLAELKEVASFMSRADDESLQISTHFPTVQKNWLIDNDYKKLMAIRRNFAAQDATLARLYGEINMMREYLQGDVQRITMSGLDFADPYANLSPVDQSLFLTKAEALIIQYEKTMEQSHVALQDIISTAAKVSVQNKDRKDDCIAEFTEKINKTTSSLAITLEVLKNHIKTERKTQFKGPSQKGT